MTPEMFDSIIADLCGSPDLKFSQRYAIQRLRKERNDLQSQLAAANERADAEKTRGDWLRRQYNELHDKYAAAVKSLEDARRQVQFPRQPNGEGGWIIDANYISAIRKDCPVEWQPGEEEIEAVLLAAERAAPVPAQPAVVPDEVVMAFGLLWHVRMGCDFPVPEGFSKNISPEEAAAKARRFLFNLLTHEQRGDGINRAAELLAVKKPLAEDHPATVLNVAALASAVRDIPSRIESLGGQRFAYVKLSEVIDTIYAHASQPAAPVAPATVAVPDGFVVVSRKAMSNATNALAHAAEHYDTVYRQAYEELREVCNLAASQREGGG